MAVLVHDEGKLTVGRDAREASCTGSEGPDLTHARLDRVT